MLFNLCRCGHSQGVHAFGPKENICGMCDCMAYQLRARREYTKPRPVEHFRQFTVPEFLKRGGN